MAVVLSEEKYNTTKKLLDSGKYNREELAQKLFMSHTIVSRVNNTANYSEYLKQFTTKLPEATKSFHSLNLNKGVTKPVTKTPVKSVEKKSEVKVSTPKRTTSRKKLVVMKKRSVWDKVKEFFS